MARPATRTFAGDIWELHEGGAWVVDPTNLSVGRDRRAVMGKGLSLQVAERFPAVPGVYGAWLLVHVRPGVPAGEPIIAAGVAPGPIVRAMRRERLLLAPVKYEWRHRASLALIERSLAGIGAFLGATPEAEVALPRLGCGAGGRDWNTEVRPLVTAWLRALPPVDAARVILVSPPDQSS